MNFKNYFLPILLAVLVWSCNDGNTGNANDNPVTKTDSSSQPTETREAFFYRQSIDIHNEVMAKMGKLIGYKKLVQQQSDSIKNMLAATDFTMPIAQRISRELDTLQLLGKKLESADSAMNTWMEQFNPDPKLPDTNAKADYFEAQKQSATAMKSLFFEALNEAERKFGPR